MERVLRLYLDDADVVQGELSVLFDERNIGECSRGVAALAITGMVGFTSRLVLPTGMDSPPHSSVSAEPNLKGEWTVGETIGFGGNSLVRLVQRTVGGEVQLFVLKSVRLRNKHGFNESLNEIEMLYKFKSDLIPTLYDACIDTTSGRGNRYGTAYLLMDFKAGGDLANFLIKKCKESGPLTEAETKAIIRPMIDALHVFHSQDCIYRDLKPENIYVDDKSNISLGDLEFVTKESDVKPGVYVGTYSVMAPEVVKQPRYTKAVDFWSVGATMYLMLTLHYPEWVKDEAMTIRNLKELSDPVQISDALKVLSEEGRDFLKRLLKVDVADRFGSVDEMKKHAWLCDPSKGTVVDTVDIFGTTEKKYNPDNFVIPTPPDIHKGIPTGRNVVYFSPDSDFQAAMKQVPKHRHLRRCFPCLFG